MSLFAESEESLAQLKSLEPDKKEAPKERLGSPEAAVAIHCKLSDDDDDSSFNRSLVQGQMDFVPPHDEKELENKGQSDRFNITTGEGAAIKNEAVAAYMDIYTTPKVLADIPLLPEVDQEFAETWGKIMAEEYTTMDRDDDQSLANHLLLADTYVTHGVAINYFDDKETLNYSVAGLDHFKFPRSTGIISSKVELASAQGEYSITELYAKIDADGEENGWSEDAIRSAILYHGEANSLQDWDNWEYVQRQIKSNDMYVTSICGPITVVHTWVKEFDGKISYYISPRYGADTKDKEKDKEKAQEFLFKGPGFYDSIDQAMQIFPFSVGNGGKLYTVRGLGYLIYQLCNAMDIMHCKLLDNARVGSSLMVQPATIEDMEDMQLIDFGGGIAIPPTMRVPERQQNPNLNNSLIPAINESRNILNRATGGLAAGNQILSPENDRQTKLEVSSKLDYINKLNSFAINLFYGPYDKVTKEKVRRAFTVKQTEPTAKGRIQEMKARCIARGVPAEVLDQIDLKGVKATRIIGTGSRSSRIMLYDQMQQMYSTWDAVGRERFEYDYLCELVGPDKADRYAGKPEETRNSDDASIAILENFQLKEGDYFDPLDGQRHMVHLPIHLEELGAELQAVDEGQLDLMEWTMENQMLYKHVIATLEITVVHESVQNELNTFQQQAQQIGELVVNGLKMINKQVKEDGEGQVKGEEEDAQLTAAEKKHQQEMAHSDQNHQQKMQQEMELQLQKLEFIKQGGEQKKVEAAQDAMSKIILKDAEAQAKLAQAKSTLI